MHSAYRKAISLLMLIVFLVGLGASGFNLKWLAHEIDHHSEALTASIDHAPRLDTQGNPASESFSDTEHKLLHALSHGELVPSLAFYGPGEPPVRTAHLLPSLLTLPPVELESPFRPPRSTPLI